MLCVTCQMVLVGLFRVGLVLIMGAFGILDWRSVVSHVDHGSLLERAFWTTSVACLGILVFLLLLYWRVLSSSGTVLLLFLTKKSTWGLAGRGHVADTLTAGGEHVGMIDVQPVVGAFLACGERFFSAEVSENPTNQEYLHLNTLLCTVAGFGAANP